MAKEFISLTHEPAKPADDVALAKDKIGFTNPNLHRRVETESESDLMKTDYSLSIIGVNSYRLTSQTIKRTPATQEIP